MPEVGIKVEMAHDVYWLLAYWCMCTYSCKLSVDVVVWQLIRCVRSSFSCGSSDCCVVDLQLVCVECELAYMTNSMHTYMYQLVYSIPSIICIRLEFMVYVIIMFKWPNTCT